MAGVAAIAAAALFKDAIRRYFGRWRRPQAWGGLPDFELTACCALAILKFPGG